MKKKGNEFFKVKAWKGTADLKETEALWVCVYVCACVFMCVCE